jgi:hypothetical protein
MNLPDKLYISVQCCSDLEEIFSLKITFVHPTCVCSYVYVTDEVFHKIVKAHHISTNPIKIVFLSINIQRA